MVRLGTLALALLGSQLPDIDTTTSTIGQICYPIAQGIATRYPHRTVTDCWRTYAFPPYQVT